MSIVYTGKKAHDDTCAVAEGVRQIATAAASSQAAVFRVLFPDFPKNDSDPN
jgi:hypothetical protein